MAIRPPLNTMTPGGGIILGPDYSDTDYAKKNHAVIDAAEDRSRGKDDGKISRDELRSYIRSLPKNDPDRRIARQLLQDFDRLDDNKTGKNDGIVSKEDINLEAESLSTLA